MFLLRRNVRNLILFLHSVLAFQDSLKAGPSNVEVPVTATDESIAPLRQHPYTFPSSGWKNLVAGHLISAVFTIQTMLSYFIDTIAGDGKSSSNFKAISATDNSAMRLFQRGFVQNIKVVASGKFVHYKARCEPEMKSTKSYLIKLSVEIVGGSGDGARNVTRVVYACGTCPFALVSLQVAKKFRFTFGPITFSRSIVSLRKKYHRVACCIVSILSPKSK